MVIRKVLFCLLAFFMVALTVSVASAEFLNVTAEDAYSGLSLQDLFVSVTPSYELTGDLAAFYPLGRESTLGTGNILDLRSGLNGTASGYVVNDGVVSGGVTINETTGAMVFDGGNTNTVVATSASTALTDIPAGAVMFRINYVDNRPSSFPRILSTEAVNWGVAIESSNARMFMVINGSTIGNVADTDLTKGQETDVFITWNSTQVRFYFDGALVHTASHSAGVPQGTSQPLGIGRHPASGTSLRDGTTMNDVRVWSSDAWSVEQIQAELSSPYAVRGDGLVGQWSAKDHTGTPASPTTILDKNFLVSTGVANNPVGWRFTSGGDYVTYGNTLYDLSGGVSFGFWAQRYDTSTATRNIMSKTTSTSTGSIRYTLSGGRLYVISDTSSDWCYAIDSRFISTEPIHVGISIEDYTCQFYINGVAIPMTDDTLSNNITLGRIGQLSSSFIGALNSISIFDDRALSSDEWLALYNEGAGREYPFPSVDPVAELSSTSGLVEFFQPQGYGITQNVTVNASDDGGYFTQSFSSVTSDIHAELVQATADFTATDVLGNTITDFNITINTTTLPSTTTWNLSAGVYNATFSKNGWYNLTKEITVNALTNHLFLIEDVYNHQAFIFVNRTTGSGGNPAEWSINISKDDFSIFYGVNETAATIKQYDNTTTSSHAFTNYVEAAEMNFTEPSYVGNIFSKLVCTRSGGTCEYRVLVEYADGSSEYTDVISIGQTTVDRFFTGYNKNKLVNRLSFENKRTGGSSGGVQYGNHRYAELEKAFVLADLTHGTYNIRFTGPTWATFDYELTLTDNTDFTVYIIQGYTANAFTIEFRNETTNDILNNVNITVQFISELQAFNQTTSNGTIYVELLTPGEYQIIYDHDQTLPRSYFTTLTPQSFQEITLYSIDEDISNFYLPRVTDARGRSCSENTVSLLRYYIDINGYRVVEMARTDTNGEAVLRVEPNTVAYKLLFTGSCGTFTTTPQKITRLSDGFTVTGAQSFLTSSQAIQNALVALNYVPETQTYVFDWTDTDNVVTQGCLIVRKNYRGIQSDEYNQCSSGSTGSLIYTLQGSLNDTIWSAQGVLYTNTEFSTYTFRGEDVSFLTSVAAWGLTGLFFAMLVILGIVLLNVQSASAIVFSTIGSIVVLAGIGIIAGGGGWIAGLVILGLIMLYKMRGT